VFIEIDLPDHGQGENTADWAAVKLTFGGMLSAALVYELTIVI
jgi:hypothetical protein